MRALKRRLAVVGTTAAIFVAMTAGGASAAILYWDNNYGGQTFAATSAGSLPGFNDKASSVIATGFVSYYENTVYRGNVLRVSGNQNAFSAYSMSF